MLFLTIGLLSSCSNIDKDDDWGELIVKNEIEFVNQSGVSPIYITYYRNSSLGVDSTGFVFSNYDTTFTQNIQLVMYVFDSVKVEYSDQKIQMHYQSNDSNEVGNICNANCYELVDKQEGKREVYEKYKFTFELLSEK